MFSFDFSKDKFFAARRTIVTQDERTVQSYVNVYAIRLFLEKVYQISIHFSKVPVCTFPY